MLPEVVALSFKVKAETLTSGNGKKFCNRYRMACWCRESTIGDDPDGFSALELNGLLRDLAKICFLQKKVTALEQDSYIAEIFTLANQWRYAIHSDQHLQDKQVNNNMKFVVLLFENRFCCTCKDFFLTEKVLEG